MITLFQILDDCPFIGIQICMFLDQLECLMNTFTGLRSSYWSGFGEYLIHFNVVEVFLHERILPQCYISIYQIPKKFLSHAYFEYYRISNSKSSPRKRHFYHMLPMKKRYFLSTFPLSIGIDKLFSLFHLEIPLWKLKSRII